MFFTIYLRQKNTNNMNIGIIGAGHIGSGLALNLVKAGHQVSITNNAGPDSLVEIAQKTGAKAVKIEEIGKEADLIIISIPQKAVLQLPKEIFSNLDEHVVVVDTGNYYPNMRDGRIEELDNRLPDSEWVQNVLGRPVVKAFNNIPYMDLATQGKAKGNQDRIAISAAGDRQADKEVVFQLFEDIGFDAVDGGTIQESWRQQPGTNLYCKNISAVEMIKRFKELGTEWTQEHADSMLVERGKQEEAVKSVDPVNHYGTDNYKKDLSFLDKK